VPLSSYHQNNTVPFLLSFFFFYSVLTIIIMCSFMHYFPPSLEYSHSPVQDKAKNQNTVKTTSLNTHNQMHVCMPTLTHACCMHARMRACAHTHTHTHTHAINRHLKEVRFQRCFVLSNYITVPAFILHLPAAKSLMSSGLFSRVSL